MPQFKVKVEKYSDGYVACALGLDGVEVGQGETYDQALADVKSAIQFHLDTFGEGMLTESTHIDALQEVPSEAPGARREKVIRSLQLLGFQLVREAEHIEMVRDNSDGTRTPITIPDHDPLNGSTLQTICTQAGISREEFLKAYEQS